MYVGNDIHGSIDTPVPYSFPEDETVQQIIFRSKLLSAADLLSCFPAFLESYVEVVDRMSEPSMCGGRESRDAFLLNDIRRRRIYTEMVSFFLEHFGDRDPAECCETPDLYLTLKRPRSDPVSPWRNQPATSTRCAMQIHAHAATGYRMKVTLVTKEEGSLVRYSPPLVQLWFYNSASRVGLIRSDAFVISHICHNGMCLNPWHVFLEGNCANLGRNTCGAGPACAHTPVCAIPGSKVASDVEDKVSRLRAWLTEMRLPYSVKIPSPCAGSRTRSYPMFEGAEGSSVHPFLVDGPTESLWQLQVHTCVVPPSMAGLFRNRLLLIPPPSGRLADELAAMDRADVSIVELGSESE